MWSTQSAGCSAKLPPKPSAVAKWPMSFSTAPKNASRSAWPKSRSRWPIANRRLRSITTKSRSPAGSIATANRSTASTTRCADSRTSTTCSWIPASAARHTRSWRKARSIRSFRQNPRNAARCSKKPPASRSSSARKRKRCANWSTPKPTCCAFRMCSPNRSAA